MTVHPRKRALEFHATTADTFNWTIVPDRIAVTAVTVDFHAVQTGSRTLFDGSSVSGVIRLGGAAEAEGLDLQVSTAIEDTLRVEAHYVPRETEQPVSVITLLNHFVPGADLPGTAGTTSTLTIPNWTSLHSRVSRLSR